METKNETLKETLRQPLSEIIRPTSLKNFVGQRHLLNSTNGTINNFITLGYLPSMILYGPPGVGKTTLAKLLAEETNYVFVEFSATDATVGQLRDLLQTLTEENLLRLRLGQERLRVAVFIDEIHRFTVVQQDFLLPFVESGAFVFLAATTVEPAKRIRKAILSRCQAFELRQLSEQQLVSVVEKAMVFENVRRRVLLDLQPIAFEDGASEVIAKYANGDSRTAINFVELLGSMEQESKAGIFLSTAKIEEFARKSTKIRLGVQNELSLALLEQLFDFMNQKEPRAVNASDPPLLLVRVNHINGEYLVTIDIKNAQGMASDLESCFDEDPERFTDDESDLKGDIYLEDDEAPIFTNRLSRSKYFVRAATHTMLQLLSHGELLQLITKHLLLYACTYIKVSSLLLPQVMSVHKALQKATIDTHVVLTNCIQQLTIAPKEDGELLTLIILDLRAFFSKKSSAKREPSDSTITVEYDDAIVEELLKEPNFTSCTSPSLMPEVEYDLDKAVFTLGDEGLSLLEEPYS